MSSYIKLNKKISPYDGEAHRLQTWISETSNNIPATLFVYQRIPSVPNFDGLSDIFVHIASYADIADYPENDPDDSSPFFRKYYADIVFTSLPELENKWTMIRGMIGLTLEDICRLNSMGPIDIEEINL